MRNLGIQLSDALTVFYVVGALASIVGVAFFFLRRPERTKRLAYEVGGPVALASVLPQSGTHRITLTFEGEGHTVHEVRGVYVQFVRMANFGKEPIRHEDLASGDPLRIDIRRAKVLDVAVAGVSRDVVGFEVEQADRSGKDVVSALLNFAFLDDGDGALVRVTSDSASALISITGTVIGMPRGIETTDASAETRPLRMLGAVLVVAAYAVSLGLAVFAFHAVTNSWQSLLLFPVPILAILLPLIPIVAVGATMWPSGPRWHPRLAPPAWAEFPREISMVWGRDFRDVIAETPVQRNDKIIRTAVDSSDEELSRAWKEVLTAMAPSRRAFFDVARASRRGSAVVLTFPYEFHRRRASELQADVEKDLRRLLGPNITLELELTHRGQRRAGRSR